MSNVLNAYEPVFYANNALIWLKKKLGMASTVYRDPEMVATPERLGSTGKMRRPSSFTATAVNTSTGGTTQDAATEEVDIAYDNWFEVKFQVFENEITFAGDRFIDEHIGPAAYAVADKIDQSLAALYKYVPSVVIASSTPALADITAARTQLFNQLVPDDGNRHLMIDGTMEGALLNLAAFNQDSGAGATGVNTQMTGRLGQKFGFNIFSNQNTPSHTTGAVASDLAGTLTGDHAKGATTVVLGALANADTINPGDTFVIAGNSQEYAYTGAQATVGSNAVTLVGVSPPLVQAYSNGAVVTLDVPTSATTKVNNLAYHRAAFGLKMAMLPMTANDLGARVFTQTDPTSGLSVRARLWYAGDTNAIKVSLDAMWAATCLDPRLATRLRAN